VTCVDIYISYKYDNTKKAFNKQINLKTLTAALDEKFVFLNSDGCI